MNYILEVDLWDLALQSLSYPSWPHWIVSYSLSPEKNPSVFSLCMKYLHKKIHTKFIKKIYLGRFWENDCKTRAALGKNYFFEKKSMSDNVLLCTVYVLALFCLSRFVCIIQILYYFVLDFLIVGQQHEGMLLAKTGSLLKVA